MKNKIVLALMALVLLFAFVGCSDDGGLSRDTAGTVSKVDVRLSTGGGSYILEWDAVEDVAEYIVIVEVEDYKGLVFSAEDGYYYYSFLSSGTYYSYDVEPQNQGSINKDDLSIDATKKDPKKWSAAVDRVSTQKARFGVLTKPLYGAEATVAYSDVNWTTYQ